MVLPTPRGAYLRVQGLLVQGMLKAVAAPTCAIRPDHDAGIVDKVVLRRQRVTPRLHVCDRTLQSHRDRCDRKLPPHHTGTLQHPPRLGREGLDTPRE